MEPEPVRCFGRPKLEGVIPWERLKVFAAKHDSK